MPVSRKRKPRHPSRSGAGRPKDAPGASGRPGYVPTPLPDDPEQAFLRVSRMQPEQLPSVGLAEYYLTSTPLRTSNQCVLASLVLMGAMREFGLPADVVALTLEMADAHGGVQRYGTDSPHLDGDLAVGHVGLIADDRFIDATAVQFPEVVAHGGVRVVSGSLSGRSEGVLRAGAVVPTRFIDGHPATYRLFPRGSADVLIRPLLERSADEVGVQVHNLVTGYTAVLSTSPLLERVQEITTPRHRAFVDAVHRMRDVEVDMGADGRMVVTRTGR